MGITATPPVAQASSLPTNVPQASSLPLPNPSHARAGSTDQSIILGMRPDPKPLKPIIHGNSERPVMIPNPRRPISSDLLEVNRRMSRVPQPQSEVLLCEPSNLRRQLGECLTKTWGRRGLHQAKPSIPVGPRWSNEHTTRPAAHFRHPLRSADPSPQSPARSGASTTRENLPEEASRWRLRFRQAYSRNNHTTRSAAESSGRQERANKGAAPKGTRKGEIVTGDYHTAPAYFNHPQYPIRTLSAIRFPIPLDTPRNFVIH